MNYNQFDPKEIAAKFLTYLRKLRNDRGAMANLRCALKSAQRQRAWPFLASFGGIDEPRYETIAGLFAYHPEETNKGNFGTTCRLLSGEHNTFDGRFRRLLGCDRDDICKHIRSVVYAASARGITINYEQLFADLWYWSDGVKVRWAREFWSVSENEEITATVVEEAMT